MMALLLGEKKSIYGVKNASDLLTKATKMFLGRLLGIILLSKSLMDSLKLLVRYRYENYGSATFRNPNFIVCTRICIF